MFIITSGCYSDYCVHGYCTTREQAERFCALKNSEKSDYGYAFEFEEVSCLDTNIDVAVLYEYFIPFVKYGECWSVNDRGHKISPTCVSTPKREVDIKFGRTETRILIDNKCWVRVTVRSENYELAKKAALDALNEKLAELNELT